MAPEAQHLRLDLRPLKAHGRVTTCAFAIQIDGQPVWPAWGEDDARVEIQIDDLLAHLTDFWKPLMLRQVYPIDDHIVRPSALRSAAEARWAELQPEVVAAEDEAVSHFEEAHDLANAFAGLFGLPHFWMMRSGDEYVLEAARTLWRLPFEDVRTSLSQAGDWICERLAGDADRWAEAITAWHERDQGDPAALLAWSTGLDRDLATSLLSEGALDAPQNFNDAVNDNDELRIAARMAGALPPDQIREIIGLARQFAGREAGTLKALAEDARALVAERFDRAAPFEQGEATARFLRERLDIPADRAVLVFDICRDLGVELRHAEAEPPSLDGLAIWGPRHGPGVFLNEASRRILGRDDTADVQTSYGARVTMAHELCHLLLDGDHALSAIEVLKARMPAGVEQRAKSFAGEFLLPTDIAADFWHEAKRPSDRRGLDAVVQELVRIYGVTRSVAAWKIEHAARRHEIDLRATLDSVAPHR